MGQSKGLSKSVNNELLDAIQQRTADTLNDLSQTWGGIQTAGRILNVLEELIMPNVDILILLIEKRIRIHHENESKLAQLAEEINEAFKNTTDRYLQNELVHLCKDVKNVFVAEDRAVWNLKKRLLREE